MTRNLIFKDIPEDENSDLEETIINIAEENLNVDINKRELESALRIGKTKTNTHIRPILVAFSSMKTRNILLQNRTQLKGSNIFIEEDLPKEEQEKY